MNDNIIREYESKFMRVYQMLKKKNGICNLGEDSFLNVVPIIFEDIGGQKGN